MKKFWLIALGVFVVLFFTALLFIGGCGSGYGDGEGTGIVVKLSNKGIFCKTWEGQMNLGGMVPGGKDGGMIPNVFNFTVSDQAVLAKMQEAQRQGKSVTVKYQEWLVRQVFRTDSGRFITDVR